MSARAAVALVLAACGGGNAKPHDAAVDTSTDAVTDGPHGPFRDPVPVHAPSAGDLALADLDGDGLVDIAVISNGNAVEVLRNTTPAGATTPSFAAPAAFTVNMGAKALFVADFNGDGKLDLATASAQLTNHSVLLSTSTPGTIGFARAVDAAPQGCLPSAGTAVGDVNGDSKPDLVVACSTNNVEILLDTTATNAATPTFSAQPLLATGTDPSAVAIADLDGDHDLDIVTANISANTVSVLTNSGSGAFAPHVDFGAGDAPDAVVATDLDGDTFPELVTGDYSGEQLSVLANHAGSGFSIATTILVPEPIALTAADIDGDHDPDLAVISNNAGAVSLVYMQGTQSVAVTQAAGAQLAWAAAVGDVNRDGKPDLAISDLTGGNVLVLLAY